MGGIRHLGDMAVQVLSRGPWRLHGFGGRVTVVGCRLGLSFGVRAGDATVSRCFAD